jgi:hypothetical protein
MESLFATCEVAMPPRLRDLMGACQEPSAAARPSMKTVVHEMKETTLEGTDGEAFSEYRKRMASQTKELTEMLWVRTTAGAPAEL